MYEKTTAPRFLLGPPNLLKIKEFEDPPPTYLLPRPFIRYLRVGLRASTLYFQPDFRGPRPAHCPASRGPLKAGCSNPRLGLVNIFGNTEPGNELQAWAK